MLRHMWHTVNARQIKHYLVQKRTNSAFAARQLTAVMHGRISLAASSFEEKNEVGQPSIGNDDVQSPPERKDDGDPDVSPLPPVRRGFTKEEKIAIQETFANNITHQSITLREVLALKSTHPLLADIESKRLLDKVRSLYSQV